MLNPNAIMVPLSPWGTILKRHREAARTTSSSRCHLSDFPPKCSLLNTAFFFSSIKPTPFFLEAITCLLLSQSSIALRDLIRFIPDLYRSLLQTSPAQILHSNGAPQHPSSVATPYYFLLIFNFLSGVESRVLSVVDSVFALSLSTSRHFPSQPSLFAAFVNFQVRKRGAGRPSRIRLRSFETQLTRLDILCS